MRKLLAVVLLAALVVLGVLAVQNGWLDGVAAPASSTGSGSGSGSEPVTGTGTGTDTGTDTGTGTGTETEPDTSTDPGSAPAIPTDATAAVVEYVHDGDTIFLEDGRKVRLLGVNTPEIGENLECYGPEATDLLRSLLPEGSPVWVQQDLEPLDQYGRSLLFVYTESGTNVNLELLRQGAAEVEMYKPNVLLRDEVYAAQDAARNANLGLWGSC